MTHSPKLKAPHGGRPQGDAPTTQGAAGAGPYKLITSLLLLPLLLLAGCGAGATRVALAQQVEQRYWNDVAHLKTHDAYMLLTPGVRQAVKESDFYQNVLSLNESTSGVSAKVGKVTVVGNCAQAQLGLQAAKAPGSSYKVYQLLYWIDGGWHISEENGQVSRTYTPLTTCAG